MVIIRLRNKHPRNNQVNKIPIDEIKLTPSSNALRAVDYLAMTTFYTHGDWAEFDLKTDEKST